jgi:aryl-alcohol dehydrogenase-like predicted oxidoreductase
MLYKEYGKTGKKVSVIGFGGMRFNKSGDKYDFDKCAQVVWKANELGVNYFDTAPFYCDDTSEAIMGYDSKTCLVNSMFRPNAQRRAAASFVRNWSFRSNV